MIFACSEYTKKEILKKYHSDKIHVVPLAADEKFNDIKDEGKIRATKEKYGLKGKYLFYVGTIFNRRHVLEAIKAFKSIHEKYSDCQFLISGRNMTRPFQNIDNKIAKIVDYINEQDLLYLYQGAELFVYLSEYEGFGLPPLEAMACGTPVLTTKKTSLAEVLGNYPIWVDDPKNVEEIKEKMMKVLDDEHLKIEMINRGLERANQFSWRKTAEETLRILLNYAK
jgi:glycosyltransferase involved in cell wall biosynthesis